MNEVIEKEEIKIENMIYEIRGKQVMLDSDLAKLYQCTNGTKDINKAVKRNPERFPDDFYFQLNFEECNFISRFQNGTLNKSEDRRGTNIKYLPHVFTEQGVAMLATILKTDVASQVSINIMRTFVLMRKYISNNLIEQKYINDMVIRHDNEIKLLQDSFNKLDSKNNDLFFEGQIYDAYSLMINIFNTAKNNITIIDNYLDKNLLDILANTDKNVLIVTNKYNNNDYIKYQQQYSNITLKINNTIHDRFIIVDDKVLYHCGASFKDLGKKCFAITKVIDDSWLRRLMQNI